MIDAAIALVSSQLNQALRHQFMASEDLVVVCNLKDADGTVAAQAANKVVAHLVNIEREAVSGVNAGLTPYTVSAQAPPVHLTLLLMFTANFSGGNYAEGLKFLSSTVNFFEAMRIFTHDNAPNLDRRIERLTLAVENLSFADLNNLWGTIGSSYLPSVLYRMRLIGVDAAQNTA
jgi:Pvc16 N-terminal domain